jgi:hypothetical protein
VFQPGSKSTFFPIFPMPSKTTPRKKAVRKPIRAAKPSKRIVSAKTVKAKSGKKAAAKTQAKKTTDRVPVWSDAGELWLVVRGKLSKVHKGRQKRQDHTRLFRVIGEKLPKESLEKVWLDQKSRGLPLTGVYMAHDSMGAPRYIGRGQIFWRLRSHFRRHSR